MRTFPPPWPVADGVIQTWIAPRCVVAVAPDANDAPQMASTHPTNAVPRNALHRDIRDLLVPVAVHKHRRNRKWTVPHRHRPPGRFSSTRGAPSRPPFLIAEDETQIVWSDDDRG